MLIALMTKLSQNVLCYQCKLLHSFLNIHVMVIKISDNLLGGCAMFEEISETFEELFLV